MIYYRKALFGRGPKLTAVQGTVGQVDLRFLMTTPLLCYIT
jgi:hypothetical protein